MGKSLFVYNPLPSSITMDVSKRTKEVRTAVQEITETEPKSRQNQLRDSEMYQTEETACYLRSVFIVLCSRPIFLTFFLGVLQQSLLLREPRPPVYLFPPYNESKLYQTIIQDTEKSMQIEKVGNQALVFNYQQSATVLLRHSTQIG